MSKVPIGQQCASIRILINAAERRMTMKQSEIDHLRPHWEAAFESLTWMMLNEKKIKSALSKDGKNGRDGNGS